MSKKRINPDSIHEYSEISKHIIGTKKKIMEIVNKPIIIWRFQIAPSVYREEDEDPNKEYVKMLITFQDDKSQQKYVVGTSSYYIVNDLKFITNDNMPMKTTVLHKLMEGKFTPDGKPKYMYTLS